MIYFTDAYLKATVFSLTILLFTENLFPTMNAEEWQRMRKNILVQLFHLFICFRSRLPLYVLLEISEHFDHVIHFGSGWRINKLRSLQASYESVNRREK